MNIFKNDKDYKVGLYFRLSKEDGDKLESESITNQRSILNRFCEENKLTVYKEYIDDGVSGLTFDRPGFKNMLVDVEKQNINMIIVKDLSRLGRDYSGVGKYMERYFPEHNVRFIAIYDEVDTITETDDMVPLRAIMNDLYCKDVSRKFRAMLYNKKKDGMYISVEAPFGYKKDPDKKGHLLVNEEESRIVKNIFSMYLNGMWTYQITKKLNNDNVPPPATGRKNVTTITNKWNPKTVREILKKEVYVGDTVLGKTKKINYKSKKIIKLPKSDWIVNRDTHEAIISREDFEVVNKSLANNSNSKINKHEYLLRGIVKCKECGCSITWLTKKEKYKDKVTIRRYGVCPTSQKEIGVKKCYKRYINYDKVEKLILEEINKVMTTYMNSINFKKLKEKHQQILNNKLASYKSRIKKIEAEIESINTKIDKAYLDKLDNVISSDDYNRISNILTKRREDYSFTLKEIKKKYQNIEFDDSNNFDDKSLRKMIRDILKSDSLKKADLLKLIDKIYIDKDKNIEIIFNFKELNLVNERV